MACSGRGLLSALAHGVPEEIAQQPWTIGREDALGMKLQHPPPPGNGGAPAMISASAVCALTSSSTGSVARAAINEW